MENENKDKIIDKLVGDSLMRELIREYDRNIESINGILKAMDGGLEDALMLAYRYLSDKKAEYTVAQNSIIGRVNTINISQGDALDVDSGFIFNPINEHGVIKVENNKDHSKDMVLFDVDEIKQIIDFLTKSLEDSKNIKTLEHLEFLEYQRLKTKFENYEK